MTPVDAGDMATFVIANTIMASLSDKVLFLCAVAKVAQSRINVVNIILKCLLLSSTSMKVLLRSNMTKQGETTLLWQDMDGPHTCRVTGFDDALDSLSALRNTS